MVFYKRRVQTRALSVFVACTYLAVGIVISGCGSDSASPSEAVSEAVSEVVSEVVVAPTTEWVPDFLAQDVATVAAVARVQFSGMKVVDEFKSGEGEVQTGDQTGDRTEVMCGYAAVQADALVLEVFKGPLKLDETVVVEWVVECPFEVGKLFLGERILFADPPAAGETAWVALENSTLGASPLVAAKLREIAGTSGQ
jgi:hypothetical protein